jgi:hypothetical protein
MAPTSGPKPACLPFLLAQYPVQSRGSPERCCQIKHMHQTSRRQSCAQAKVHGRVCRTSAYSMQPGAQAVVELEQELLTQMSACDLALPYTTSSTETRQMATLVDAAQQYAGRKVCQRLSIPYRCQPRCDGTPGSPCGSCHMPPWPMYCSRCQMVPAGCASQGLEYRSLLKGSPEW